MGDRGVTVVSEPDPDKCGVKKALTVGVTVMVRNEDVGIYNVDMHFNVVSTTSEENGIVERTEKHQNHSCNYFKTSINTLEIGYFRF
ncbi:hypothetical protein AXX17_AT4G11070 [Arabidopsis thaliana]|uniref:Uncharacterized protein n=1 Tax=Arabidopsis thaliana TaxID=3702 RepID=A0A178V053_ARATH|nr:hypothetical protein AXX17_AT4G11070 [Arabidopsis thaliana]